MLIVGIVLSAFGIGFFCWLLFSLAVYALIVAVLTGGATLMIGQIAFAVVGAVLVGGTAWARMSLFVPPYVERRVAGGPASFPLAEATREACACASLPIGWISARSPLVRATGERRAPSQRLDMSAPSPSGG